jgi:hypothetical protein
MISIEEADYPTTAPVATIDEMEIPPTYKLGYTPRNAPLHFYTESLSGLLVALDTIESWGVRRFWEQKRKVFIKIEEDAGLVERRVRCICVERSREVTPRVTPEAVETTEFEKPSEGDVLTPSAPEGSDCDMEEVEEMVHLDESPQEISPPEIETGFSVISGPTAQTNSRSEEEGGAARSEVDMDSADDYEHLTGLDIGEFFNEPVSSTST